jgi:hypothetical protein
MSLERKDVRLKLDPELHGALSEICAIDGVEIGEFVEHLLIPVIRKRCADAIALSRALREAGFSGSGRE